MKGVIAMKKTTWACTNDWLCLLTVIITIVQMGIFVTEFLKPGILKIPKETPFLYFIILAFWVIKKEIERWLKKKWVKRKGEIYVMAWLALGWIMVLISSFFKGKYQIPAKLMETILYVVFIYIGSCFSKYKKYKQLSDKRGRIAKERAKMAHKQKVKVS